MSSSTAWKQSPWFSAQGFEAFRPGRFIVVDLLSLQRFPMLRVLIYLLISLLLTAGCNRPAEAPTAAGKDCIEDYDPATDYFPDKTQLEFAQNFSVEYHHSYKVVTVRPADGSVEEKYVLLQCGAPAPNLEGELSKARVIAIPITSLFSAASAHMPLLVDLGHVDVLTGVGQARYITTEPVLDWIRQGHVTEYAPNDVIDTELVILKAPSILMSSGGYPDAYNTLRKAGVAVVANVEWQEPSALARAEWLKFMALFLNEERKAREQFKAVRDRYIALKERASQVPEKDRPRVMTGTVYRGMFNIAGGASYVAQLISDAGGDVCLGGQQGLRRDIRRYGVADRTCIRRGFLDQWWRLEESQGDVRRGAALQTVQTIPAWQRLAVQPYRE